MELNGSRREVLRNESKTCCRRTFCAPVVLLRTILVLAAVSLAASSSQNCPAQCSCMQRDVWCHSKGLRSVPANIPVDTKNLYLFDNNITNIPEGSLSRLKDLEILDISFNSLTNRALRSTELSSLKNLRELMIAHNKLTSIPADLFSGMQNLVRLYLVSNEIQAIEQNALRNMSNLLELQLSDNRLTTFPKIVSCPKLKRICLEDNRLTRIMYNSLTQVNLEELLLSGNRLNGLQSSIFGDTSNLRKFDISDNHFRRVPKIIRNMTSLQNLNLSGNSIASLPDDLLQGMRKLKVLDLHSMKLTRLSKSFIPRGVFLNVADFSNNPWTCDCDIAWLPKLIRLLDGAFVKLSSVQCKLPANLSFRQVVTLENDDLNCGSATTADSGEKQDGASGTLKHPQPTPRKPPTVDLCDGLACANGAVCYINETTYRPACRCTPGWKGLLCDKAVIIRRPPTTTTNRAPASKPGLSPQPQLLIVTDTLTPTSAEIILPRTDRQLTVTLFEIKSDDPHVKQTLVSNYNILPSKQPYTVSNLRAGRRYNICITATDLVPSGRVIEDKLCGVVITPGTAHVPLPDNSAAGHPSPDILKSTEAVPEAKDNELGHSEVYEQGNAAEVDGARAEEFKVLYPAIGAGIGALIILVIILFVCYRNKKKVKHDNSSDGGRPGTPKEYTNRHSATTGADPEAMPMMVSPQRVQYVPQPLLQQPADTYQQQAPQHTFQAIRASPQRVGTPNKNGSLGRSSTSGGSVAGSQAPYIMDQQRSCHSDSGYETIRPVPAQITVDEIGAVPHANYHGNGGHYAGHAPYTSSQVPCTSAYVPVLTNRNQEYVYRSNGHAGQHVTYADARYPEHAVQPVVVPVRATNTTVNQYYQGPIPATTVSPECLYRPINTPTAVNGFVPVSVMPAQYPPQKHMNTRYTASAAPHDPYASHRRPGAFQDTPVM